MSADDDALRGVGRAFEKRLDIAQRQLGELERLAARCIAARRQLRRDVLSGTFERSVTPQIAFADGSGEHLDVPAKPRRGRLSCHEQSLSLFDDRWLPADRRSLKSELT
jgi:hypothetical protein